MLLLLVYHRVSVLFADFSSFYAPRTTTWRNAFVCSGPP